MSEKTLQQITGEVIEECGIDVDAKTGVKKLFEKAFDLSDSEYDKFCDELEKCFLDDSPTNKR